MARSGPHKLRGMAISSRRLSGVLGIRPRETRRNLKGGKNPINARIASGLPQAQYIHHVVKPGLFVGEESRSAQRA